MSDGPRILSQRYATETPTALREHPRNARRGDEEFIDESILQNGFFGAVVADERPEHRGEVLVGNHRYRRLVRAGAVVVPVLWVTPDNDDHAMRIMLADNAANDRASYDRKALADLLKECVAQPAGLVGTGHTQATLDALLAEISRGNEGGSGGADGDGEAQGKGGPTLTERFGVPPFSVLDARQGYWQARKAEWLAMGLRSELGRGERVTFESDEVVDFDHYRRKNGTKYAEAFASTDKLSALMGQRRKQKIADNLAGAQASPAALRLKAEGGSPVKLQGTSIFDPVLCELVYRWFSPRGGLVLDPFAGGSVRGVVASRLGRRYLGIELRTEQVAANREQWRLLGRAEDPAPEWRQGDSREVLPEVDAEADLIFSCPPYADLEVYSDDPRDLSTYRYPEFREAYAQIIDKAVARLRTDRFAVFVVGEVRGTDGLYRGLVEDTIRAFRDAGARFYNEMILVTMVGSLSVRAGRFFDAARKIGKTHQNVLVFCKGDPKRATAALGAIEGGVSLGDETLGVTETGNEDDAGEGEDAPAD